MKFLLTAFFCGASWLWLSLDQAPPQWDDAFYLTNSLRMYDALATGGLAGYAMQFLTILGFKAPLITVLPTPFYLLLGRHWRVAYAVNIVAMAVLFAALWAIAKRIANERTAFIAVFAAATMPLLYGLSRWYLTEYAMAALVAVALWLLLISKDFEDRRVTALFGVTCGLGLLLKVSYPVFVIVPAVANLRRASQKGRAVVLIAIPCLVLALPWYLINWRRTFANALDAGFGESAIRQGTGDIFTLQAITTYVERLTREGVSYCWLIAGLAAVGMLAVRKDRETLRWLAVFALFLLPFGLFVFGTNKDIRYTAPLFPLVALAIAKVIDRAIGGQTWLLAPVLAIPLFSFVTISFAWPYRVGDVGYARAFQTQRWFHDEILDAIRARADFHAGERKRLVVGTDRGSFNTDNFELAVLQARLPFTVETTAYEKSLEALLHNVRSASFLIYKEGGEAESTFLNRHSVEVMQRIRAAPGVTEIGYAPRLPDGGVARIFQLAGPSLPTEAPPFDAAFGDMVELTGLSIRKTPTAIEVQCRWRCVRAVDREYWAFVHIVDDSGAIVGQSDYPLERQWKPGDTRIEDRRIAIPNARSGLRVRLGVYHPPTGDRLSVTRVPPSPASLTEDRTGIWIKP